MISNNEIAEQFKWFADLSELHGGNPFKIKSFQSASYRIDRIPTPLAEKTTEELASTEGIGKSIAAKITEIIQTGSFAELTELVQQTPEGVIALFKVKGIGPKKIAYIWKNLGIESIGELLYACKENRLAQAKGFGAKTQQAIIESIEFIFSNANKFHYAKTERLALELLTLIQAELKSDLVSFCGAFRRKCEVLETIDIVAATKPIVIQFVLQNLALASDVQITNNVVSFKLARSLPVNIICCEQTEFIKTLWQYTGSSEHITQLQVPENAASEYDIYAFNNMQFVEPEMREGLHEIKKAKAYSIPELITFNDLRGTLHNHTTYSDGSHTLVQMAEKAQALGLEYLGICDHSQSAQYAGGLDASAILKQHEEINQLNKKYAPFKIFKGIESDILGDGSLDYPNEILQSFDFIVASIHSNLKMNEEKAMSRLLRAIENPYTTMLGHPTGRLLLMREGYPVDHKKMIDACAANGVIIEINANPYRLDLDWRWIDYALEKNVMLSINPDAHEMDGYLDMHFGIHIARKGGLSKSLCFNALSATEVEHYFKTKRTTCV